MNFDKLKLIRIDIGTNDKLTQIRRKIHNLEENILLLLLIETKTILTSTQIHERGERIDQ